MYLLMSDHGAIDILPEIESGQLDFVFDPPIAEDEPFHRDDRIYRDSSDAFVVGDRFEAFRWAIQASAPRAR